MKQNLWAIVLAGGQGTRLAETARKACGSSLPKQFLHFGQARTFLQATIERLLPLVPSRRIVVVVPREHRSVAVGQVAPYPGIELVDQPRLCGTGPGVLLPLVHVLRRDPDANVALIPADHHFDNAARLRDALESAHESALQVSSGTVLVGAPAQGPATDLGWIELGSAMGPEGTRAVREFVEKPSPSRARALSSSNALWNTMIGVGKAEALWRLCQEHLPEHSRRFAAYYEWIGSGLAERALQLAYADMPSADFSRDVMEPARHLYALSLQSAGWSDCGTPERLEAAFGPRATLPLARGSLLAERAARGAA